MPHSTLFNILRSAIWGSKAEQAAALAAATAHLQRLSFVDAGSQLTYHDGAGKGVLHLLAVWFSECEQASSFLSLVIERDRESCGTTVLTGLADALGETSLHSSAGYCSDLSLTKIVLREHPPSLAVLDINGRTPLRTAENVYGSTSSRAVFFRTATAAYNTSNFVALEALCGGSSPYLSSEIHRQAIDLRVAVAICLNRQEELPPALTYLVSEVRKQVRASLRAAVAICLNRQEEAPSALITVEAGVALSLLERLRDFGRVGNSSDLLRAVLEFVGPYAE